MAADEIQVVTASAVLGEIETRGRMLAKNGEPVARFRQLWRLWRGSRVLHLEIEIEPLVELQADPWNSYYACRFAWSDEAADVYGSVNQTRQRLTKKRLETPLFIELESGSRRTALLFGGLPYHRRVAERMLDTLLIVRGERERKFRLGIGLDVNQLLAESLAVLSPPAVVEAVAAPPAPSHSWMFHLDARSAVATHWSLLYEVGRVVGLRTRLLESMGRSTRTRLSSFRSFTAARLVNFLGEPLSELAVEQGKVVIDLAANEWVEVEARWEGAR